MLYGTTIDISTSSFLLQNAYLPTMPEDHLPEARRVLLAKERGTFYGTYSSMTILLVILKSTAVALTY